MRIAFHQISMNRAMESVWLVVKSLTAKTMQTVALEKIAKIQMNVPWGKKIYSNVSKTSKETWCAELFLVPFIFKRGWD